MNYKVGFSRWKHCCFPAIAVRLAAESTYSDTLKEILSTFNYLASKACRQPYNCSERYWA